MLFKSKAKAQQPNAASVNPFGANTKASSTRSKAIFATYEDRLPSNQTAVDAVPGWSSCLPAEANVEVGKALPLFNDTRIHWALQQYGDIKGRQVLELGPLEGAHTWMLNRAGAKIDAIEANKMAFLRCLVTKEILGLPNARFMLGDFIKWLEQSETSYDLIVASGVLYHMRDPLRLLRALAAKTTALYLWTVCVTGDTLVPSDSGTINGKPMRLYKYSYQNVETNDDFCGGMEDHHYWMHRDDILTALEALGFTSLVLAHEQPNDPHGPTFSVFARKTGASDTPV